MASAKIKYIVTKPWGNRRKGEILPESREVRRKLAEGGCVEEFTAELQKEKDAEAKKKADARKKKQEDNAKNKMQPDPPSNKGVK